MRVEPYRRKDHVVEEGHQVLPNSVPNLLTKCHVSGGEGLTWEEMEQGLSRDVVEGLSRDVMTEKRSCYAKYMTRVRAVTEGSDSHLLF